ncbi:hypothetical protein NVP2275O_043 [Vibrio phage 2.275.O._10N.286.54.E11]|nr:hypothetical protein NVP2275O_043 [Vibrio phage 2.275.O._10N.286.54.E11]
MKHYDLPYIDKIIEDDAAFQAILVLLEDACQQCSQPDTMNRAMANLCRQTYQNLEHIRETAVVLKKKRDA